MKNPFTADGFKTSIPWLALLVGIMAITYGNFGNFMNVRFGEYLADIGKTILAGGIFALMLKTYQFMGIFKEELAKIVYDPRFLNNRKDLVDVWESVSKVMFKNRFPRISKGITDDVKLYFPTDQVIYYDDYKVVLDVSLENADRLKVNQKTEFTIHPSEENHNIPFLSKNEVLFEKHESEVSFQLLKFMLNDTDILKKLRVTKKVNSGSVVHSYSVDLTECQNYKCEIEVEKEYYLKVDHVIGIRKQVIIHNLNVKIFLAKGLKIDFHRAGTLLEFKKVNVKNTQYFEYEYKGIIYPQQGFIIFVYKE